MTDGSPRSMVLPIGGRQSSLACVREIFGTMHLSKETRRVTHATEPHQKPLEDLLSHRLLGPVPEYVSQ